MLRTLPPLAAPTPPLQGFLRSIPCPCCRAPLNPAAPSGAFSGRTGPVCLQPSTGAGGCEPQFREPQRPTTGAPGRGCTLGLRCDWWVRGGETGLCPQGLTGWQGGQGKLEAHGGCSKGGVGPPSAGSEVGEMWVGGGFLRERGQRGSLRTEGGWPVRRGPGRRACPPADTEPATWQGRRSRQGSERSFWRPVLSPGWC